MKYFIRFKKSAAKEIRSLPALVSKKMAKAIDNLSENPRPAGCKKLVTNEEPLWRIRIGDYRVVYTVEDEIKIIEVRKIGHRRDIYN